MGTLTLPTHLLTTVLHPDHPTAVLLFDLITPYHTAAPYGITVPFSCQLVCSWSTSCRQKEIQDAMAKMPKLIADYRVGVMTSALNSATAD